MTADEQIAPAAALPWTDRPQPGRDGPFPRSERDLAILRALARRIPANDAGAHNNLGVVYFSKGMLDEAAERFERALELDPRMHVAERNLQIVYFNSGFYDEAVKQLSERLAAQPTDAAARMRLARIYLFGGDAAAALRELDRLQALRPDDAEAQRWIARAELRRGDLDAAVRVLRRAAELAPADAGVSRQLGEVLYMRGMAAEARTWLERALSIEEADAEAHHLLAFVCGELGDEPAAEAHAARARELNPGYGRVEKSLSLDRYNEARFEELVADRAPRPASGGGLVHYSLGIALRQKGLYDEALREFERGIERGEDRFLLEQAQAELFLLQGESERAAAMYGDLIEDEPASPKLWNELGVANHQLGRLVEAQEAYLRAIQLDNTYALAWNNLGVVRHHRDEPESDAAFAAALKTGRSLAEVWRNLAWLHHLRRDEGAAERAYRQALDSDGQLASAWTGLGMLYLEQGHVDQARNALARAVECDPNSPEAHYHYAFSLSAAGDYPGALRETSRALELNPYITYPRFRLLIDLQFEDAGVPAPDLDAAERLQGGATIEAFDFDPEALDILGPASTPEIHTDPEPEPLAPSTPASIEGLAAARAAHAAGDFAEAMAAVHRAAALGANRIETQLLQGEIHLASGAAGEAVERFDAVLRELQHVHDPEAVGIDALDVKRRALAGLAIAFVELDRPTLAVDAAERWHALTPHDIRATTVLADALEADGQPARAADILEAALAREPHDLELLTRLGAAWVAAGNFERAEPALRTVIARSRDLPAARAALGRLLVTMGRPDEAEREFEAALAAIPSFAEAALGLADLHMEMRRPARAIEVLASFLEVDPYHFQALVRLGDVLWQTGRQSEAGVAYRRVLHFDPGHQAALEGLERLEPDEVDAADWPAPV